MSTKPKKQWKTYTLGFSDLSEAQEATIEAMFDALQENIGDQDITVEAFTSDSGDM